MSTYSKCRIMARGQAPERSVRQLNDPSLEGWATSAPLPPERDEEQRAPHRNEDDPYAPHYEEHHEARSRNGHVPGIVGVDLELDLLSHEHGLVIVPELHLRVCLSLIGIAHVHLMRDVDAGVAPPVSVGSDDDVGYLRRDLLAAAVFSVGRLGAVDAYNKDDQTDQQKHESENS